MSENKPLPRLPLSGEEPKPVSPSTCSALAGGELKAPSLDKGRAGEGFGLAPESAFLPYNKKLTDRARENRKNPTKAESRIWNEVLRMRQFSEYKFLRQKPIDNYIVDFYCSELRLVIEIDGDSHAETVEYDAERTRLLQSLGLTVVRYTNDDVMRNIHGVFDDLSEKIKRVTPLVHPTPLAPLVRGGLKAPSPDKRRGLMEADADE
jgi:very-short-patch-repair endonuclease